MRIVEKTCKENYLRKTSAEKVVRIPHQIDRVLDLNKISDPNKVEMKGSTS